MPRPVVRLSKELREAQTNPEPDIALSIYDPSVHRFPLPAGARSHTNNNNNSSSNSNGGDLFTWVAQLRGPEGTPFEGGTYTLVLAVPADYPMMPPAAFFATPVFHPNIEFASGRVCLDILKGRWSPAWTLAAVCRAVLHLLSEPAADSPFNCDAGNLVRAGDERGYASMVRLYAIEYAGAPAYPDGW